MGAGSVDWFDLVDPRRRVGSARPSSSASAGASSERGSTGVIGSRSNGAGRREPTSRARVIARSPNRWRTSSAASVTFRRRGSSAANSDSCSRSPRPDAVTPRSRIAEPADLRPGELERRPEDRLGQVGRLGQRPLAGDRPEGRVADLDRDRRRLDAAVAEPAGDALAHPEERPLDDLAVRRVDVERVLVADRLGRVATADRVVVDARAPARPSDAPCLPKRRTRRSSGRAARSPIVLTPYSRSTAADFSPTPHSRRISSGARNAASSPGSTTTRPSGLRRSDAILATSLVVATPTEIVRSTAP